VAEHVTTGEGNRLGRGARCGGDTATAQRRLCGREAARETRGRGNARGERVATYVLHQGEFDRKSGKLANLARSAHWRREVAAEHALLSTASRKTLRLDRLAQYHAVAEATAEACWANRSKTRIARAAFGVWSRSTAMLDSFWASVRRGRARDGTLHRESRTLLGYGAGWGNTGGGPHKRVRDSADRVFGAARVITVDEFNTSKTCHVCGDVLQGVLDRAKNFKRGAPAGAVERGLKHCARRTCSSFLDRDVNAALNMLKALLADLRSRERPRHLGRDSVLHNPQSVVCVSRRPVRPMGPSGPN
jgi:hypothetical protein